MVRSHLTNALLPDNSLDLNISLKVEVNGYITKSMENSSDNKYKYD